MKVPPTQKEVEICEGWKRVRQETPSEHEDEIRDKLIAGGIATEEEILVTMNVIMAGREDFNATKAIRKNAASSSNSAVSEEKRHAYLLASAHVGEGVKPDAATVDAFDRMLKDICRVKELSSDEALKQTVTAMAYVESKGVSISLLKFMEAVHRITMKSDSDLTYGEILVQFSKMVIEDAHWRTNR